MCAALRADLVAADVEVFDGDAVRVADRHAAGCADCTARRKLSVDAVRLFAAIPILAIPALRAKTAYALAAAGVPMQGSHAFDGGAPPPPPKRNGGSHARRWIIAGAVAGIILILAVIVGASSVGHEPSHVVVVVAKSTTSSSSVATTTSSTSSTTTSTTSTTTTVPVTVAPPPVTTTTQPPVVARLTLKPSTVTQDYATTAAAAPLVTWSTSGLARLDVHDDGKAFDRTSASGSALVCPGKADTTPKGTCTAKPGTYVYTLDGFDSSNNLVVHRTLTLTIKSAGP
jgi:hypothetical protein